VIEFVTGKGVKNRIPSRQQDKRLLEGKAAVMGEKKGRGGTDPLEQTSTRLRGKKAKFLKKNDRFKLIHDSR